MTDVVVPEWPDGTACVLATGGGPAHAIPVTTAVRASATTVVLGLGRRRTSLERLRRDPEVALCVMAGRDLAFTLTGTADVIEEDAGGVAAVRVAVTGVQDHATADFTIEAGVDWHWTDEDAAAGDADVRAALRGLGA